MGIVTKNQNYYVQQRYKQFIESIQIHVLKHKYLLLNLFLRGANRNLGAKRILRRVEVLIMMIIIIIQINKNFALASIHHALLSCTTCMAVTCLAVASGLNKCFFAADVLLATLTSCEEVSGLAIAFTVDPWSPHRVLSYYLHLFDGFVANNTAGCKFGKHYLLSTEAVGALQKDRLLG